MVWIPSFLTFPVNLPSLPSISLPANIQRRFLSYVLKRALGRFVVASGLDVDRIQGQVSQGLVEIERLELNSDEINDFIPKGLPFTVTSGEVANVVARVPVRNLWSDPLSLSVDSLTIDISITSPNTKGNAPLSSIPTSHLHHLDLASSVTSAADDFVHDELDAFEGAELDRSIRESLVLADVAPPNSHGVPGAFPPHIGGGTQGFDTESPPHPGVETTTVLASLVERVLARLECAVRNVKVRVRYQDEARSGIIELRVNEVRYADETPETERNTTVRAVTVSGVSVYVLPIPANESKMDETASSIRRSSFSSSSSMSSDDSDLSSNDEFHDMMMSQAIADLRQSTMTAASGKSVYLSVIDDSTMPVGDSTQLRSTAAQIPEAPGANSRSATPTPPKSNEPTETMILSFGSEDIRFRLTTTTSHEQLEPQTTMSSSSQLPAVSNRHLPAVSMDLSFGTISSVLLPADCALVLAMACAAAPSSQSDRRQPDKGLDQVVIQPKFDMQVSLKALYLALVYDLASPKPEFEASRQQFFSRPASFYLPIGHVRVRMQDLTASYAVPAFSGSNLVARKGSDKRRPPPTLPPPAVIRLTVDSISVFEFLASTSLTTDKDEPPGGLFPVLIFDPNLPKQYEIPPGATFSFNSPRPHVPITSRPLPEFDTVDWRNPGDERRGGEKGWRVRAKGRGILRQASATSGTASPEPHVVLSVEKKLDEKEAASVTLLPVHAFLDLSLVERLLPLLRELAPVVQLKTDPARTPTGPPPTSLHRLSALRHSESIVDDLKTAATRQPRRSGSTNVLTVQCPMIRLDIRCPAPPSRRGSWGDGAHLRSGIVTLDIHGLAAKVNRQPATEHQNVRHHGHGPSESPVLNDGVHVEWQKMIFLFSRVPSGKATPSGSNRTSERRSRTFLCVGPLAPDPGDEDLLLPTVHMHTQAASHTARKTTSITCKIPSVQANIRQTTVEGLQFFADDITHWLDGAFGDGSAPKPKDDLKMIGSRFFGSKASSSASSSAVDDEDADTLAATVLSVAVSETEVTLLVPRVNKSSESTERVVSLHTSDLDLKLESNNLDTQETTVTISTMNADLFHQDHLQAAPTRLFGRTTPLTLTTHTQPVVHFRFSSMASGLHTKETGIRLLVNACTVHVNKELDWIHDLALYAKTPEGVFEDVVPSEVTRIHVSFSDFSIHVNAPTLPGALLSVIDVLEVKTALESDTDDTTVAIGASGMHLLAIDDLGTSSPLETGYTVSLNAWKRSGYAELVEVITLDAQLLRSFVPTETVLLDIFSTQIRVGACADSFSTLGALVGDLGKFVPRTNAEPTHDPRHHASLEKSIDVFASVDQDAFGQAPDIVAGADMINDDLPTNMHYLDHAASQSAKAPYVDPITGESLRSWEPTDDSPQIQADIGGGSIKILMTEPFDPEPNYWDNLPVLTNSEETRVGKVRVRVQNSSVTILLHDGYDWPKTRKVIEDEIKAVRRRLQKIRQLLTDGQKADASMEGASSVLFNSVYIGLDGGPGEMDSTQLLAAIDEELDGLDFAETTTQSSWQTLPEAGALPRVAGSSKRSHVRLRGKRLSRSKKGQIEFALNGLAADVDIYDAGDETASRIHVTARSFDILDHIKTSTWKKFLTEMKADSRGNIRETGADMIRLELINVRPNLPSTEEEIRVRAKILPLRLHVDQDALDFLKCFFSFSTGDPVPHEEVEPKQEPFFQHVEIFPVELKLDYKPKRVDYAALRHGRTIELMNFFHFDGAEMTLRHVTLSGITGATRLSNLLQDIWTPDVKANQLADVISGVSPIRSMVNVGSGVADLILLPIEQYRKDGRVARGVQRGTNSFVRSTALEVMKLGARLATGTQVVLERAEGMLEGRPGDSVVLEATANDYDSEDDGGENALSRNANQPSDVREGVKEAYKSLSTNLNSAAQTILAVPMEVYERSGNDGPLKAVVRAVPIAVLKPMIGASEAVSKTLWGLRNTLDPDSRLEMGDKYK